MIRAARKSDAAVIGQLWLQLAEYYRMLDDRMPVPAEDGAQRYASRIVNSLEDSHIRVLVAEEKGVIIGYVLGVIVDTLPEMFVEEHTGFLADIFVLPDYRGRGTGRALVEALKSWFRERGIAHFDWHVATANTEGIAFWRAIHGEDVMIRMRARTGE